MGGHGHSSQETWDSAHWCFPQEKEADAQPERPFAPLAKEGKDKGVNQGTGDGCCTVSKSDARKGTRREEKGWQNEASARYA